MQGILKSSKQTKVARLSVNSTGSKERRNGRREFSYHSNEKGREDEHHWEEKAGPVIMGK